MDKVEGAGTSKSQMPAPAPATPTQQKGLAKDAAIFRLTSNPRQRGYAYPKPALRSCKACQPRSPPSHVRLGRPAENSCSITADQCMPTLISAAPNRKSTCIQVPPRRRQNRACLAFEELSDLRHTGHRSIDLYQDLPLSLPLVHPQHRRCGQRWGWSES